jgi:hypothetical protein
MLRRHVYFTSAPLLLETPGQLCGWGAVADLMRLSRLGERVHMSNRSLDFRTKRVEKTIPMRGLLPQNEAVRAVEAAALAQDGSPPITRNTLPACRAHYPGGSTDSARIKSEV